MSNEATHVSPPSTEPPASTVSDVRAKKILRRRTAKFVLVFVVSVFVFLEGYELARWTKANDWYLLQVARSTTWLLKRVGYSCILGSGDRYKGREAEVRAALDAWGRGEEAPNPPPPSNNEPILSPWEAWEYQAAGARRNIEQAKAEVKKLEADATLQEPDRSARIDAARGKAAMLKQREMGPLVSFIFKAGADRRLVDARTRLKAFQEDSTLDPETRAKRVAAVEAELPKLEEALRAEAASPPPYSHNRTSLGFSFVVIPDCGAVQSMAIFLSAILAFPARWWKRIVGILAGLPILYWVNAFRLAFLAVIGAWDNGGEWFKFSHEYVWQGIYIVFVVALWMSWVELLVRRRA